MTIEGPAGEGRRGKAALSRRLDRFERIAAMQSRLASLGFDLEPFIREVVEGVMAFTPAMGVIVELVDGDEMVYRAVSAGFQPHLGTRIPRQGSLSGLCVELGETLYCRDSETDPRVDRAACRKVGLRSMICAPLAAERGPVGALKALSDAPDAFDAEALEVIQLLAHALGAGLARQLAFDALEREVEARRQAEASLGALEAETRKIVTHAHHAIVTMDEAGRVVGWNRAAEATFGWSEAEAQGALVSELIIPAELRERHQKGLARFLATGEEAVMNRRLELTAVRKDGQAIPIEIGISAVESPDGWRFTALMQDVTERKAETELFENAFQNAAIGLALIGLKGDFMRVNAAFCALVGFNEAELVASDFQTITHPDDLDADLELLGQLTRGERASYQIDKRYLRRTGGVVWVNLSVSMIRHQDGSPKHYVAQVQDLTARMDAEARYRLMAENTTDMIVTSDMHGRTTFVSAGVRAMTGWTPAEALGRGTQEFVHPEDLPAMHAVFGRTAAGESGLRVRWRGWNRDRNDWVWLESSPSMLRKGGETSFLDVVRDVSGQVAQEEALARATDAAEAAAAAKAEFLANMSHEIRTPLTAIMGFSRLLSEQPELSEGSRRYVERVGFAGRALMALVNDVLDFSKLEAGLVECHAAPIDPFQAGREVLQLFEPQAAEKGLTLAFEGDGEGRVMLDPGHFNQILLNLIGNALKFTEAGGVTLRLAHRKGRLEVAVQDTGPGLSRAAQRTLFQRFSQVDGSSTRRHGGTGLGLAICKGLVEAMGGAIGVRSAPGKGAVFHFRVPAPAAPTGEAAQAGHALLPTLDGLRILVVDDGATNRELARAILERAGAEVAEAVGGAEAVEAAGDFPFDAILMDLDMPGLDGREAARRIRGEPGPNRHVPIIAFSAAADARDGDFEAVVGKPIDPDALVATLAAALEDQLLHLQEDRSDVQFG